MVITIIMDLDQMGLADATLVLGEMVVITAIVTITVITATTIIIEELIKVGLRLSAIYALLRSDFHWAPKV